MIELATKEEKLVKGIIRMIVNITVLTESRNKLKKKNRQENNFFYSGV